MSSQRDIRFISIIVPVYNGEKTIGECLDSLLAQDYPRGQYEIIVVDNGSRDGTREIVKRYEVRGTRCEVRGARCEGKKTSNLEPQTSNLKLLYEPVRGSYKSRNTGIKVAKGDIIAFTDADCIVDKEWLKKGVEGFVDEKVGSVAGGIEAYKPSNYIEDYLSDKKELSQDKSLDEAFMPYAKTANVFYRKDVFEKIGVFEEKWTSGGDADLAWRMQIETDFKMKYVPGAKVRHRHRSDIRGMFRQCVTWGIGDANLYKKYQTKMKSKKLKQNIWTVFHILDVIVRTLPFMLSRSKSTFPEERRTISLDRLCYIGWEWGRIAGSIRNRVFYV